MSWPQRFATLLPLLFLLAVPSAVAQLEVRLQPEAGNFVAHAPVRVKVTIINRHAKEITLDGPSEAASWLNFRITNSTGDLVTSRPDAPLAGELNIEASKSVTLRVNLNRAYPLDRFGNYRVTANVYDPGTKRYSSSAPKIITVDEAKTIWRQTAGLADGSRHEFSLLTYRGFDRTQLYFRLKNADTGLVERTYQLSEMVRYHPPQAAIDHQSQLHVLYQAAPRQYVHDQIGPDGTFIKRHLYDESRGSRPQLVQARDGSVRVAGGVDPQAERRAKLEKLKKLTQIRRLSERPPGY